MNVLKGVHIVVSSALCSDLPVSAPWIVIFCLPPFRGEMKFVHFTFVIQHNVADKLVMK